MSITTRNREIPVGQKPSGITKKPSGMPFPTANRRESADRNSSLGKGTIPCQMADRKQSLSVIPVVVRFDQSTLDFATAAVRDCRQEK